MAGPCKSEPAAGVKVELRDRFKAVVLKREAALRPKPEVKGELGVKYEPRLKADLFVKGEQKVKAEHLKGEHKIKAEGRSVKGEDTGVEGLVQRGQKLREMADRAKKRLKQPRKKTSRKNGKRRVSAARRNASREGMNRLVSLSPELADVVGAPALSRPEAVKKLWAHCRENGLLNPADKREICFDERLQHLFGKPTARLTDLVGLLVPHFDFTQSVSATTLKNPAKSEQGVKRQAKTESKREQKTELKQEQKVGLTAPPVQEAEAAAFSAAIPQLTRIALDEVSVELRIPLGRGHRLEAVARPDVADSEDACVRAQCLVEMREEPNDGLVEYVSARLCGLSPQQSYRVAVEIYKPVCGNVTLRSTEVLVPQRAKPGQWTVGEALSWCGSLRVPELVRAVRDYGIDGKTLLSLGGEDLRAFGVTAPFLVRRVLAALEAIRGQSTTA
mmetsp:Transcript_23563/g.52191  ORF Transcript_23563/g.52191 Transcript_23563/m.52191 type:complete len:446 (-) Transcript_23563:108-1445(-)